MFNNVKKLVVVTMVIAMAFGCTGCGAVTTVVDTAKNVGSTVVDTAKNVGTAVADTAKGGAATVGNWVTGTDKNEVVEKTGVKPIQVETIETETIETETILYEDVTTSWPD